MSSIKYMIGPILVNEINPNVDVFLDGGIREGTDVLKALALGAKMVFIGSTLLIAEA